MDGFYCDLFDTARTDPTERDTATGLLKVLTLTSLEPIYLSLNHGADSAVILDACADDPGFLRLVECGRIRFRPYPNQNNPLELLAGRLQRKGAQLTAWDTTVDLCGIKRTDLLAALTDQRVLPVKGNVQALAKRVHCLRDLANVVTSATKFQTEPEQVRRPFMEREIALIHQVLPAHSPIELRELFRDLARFDDRGERSHVYTHIENSSYDGTTRLRARDIVDLIYNRSLTYSLRYDHLLTVKKHRTDSLDDVRWEEATRCGFSVEVRVTTETAVDADSHLSWATVEKVLGSRLEAGVLTQSGRACVIEEVAERSRGSRPWTEAVFTAAASGLSGGLAAYMAPTPSLDYWFSAGVALWSFCTAFSGFLAQQAVQLTNEEDTRHSLNAWIGRYDKQNIS